MTHHRMRAAGLIATFVDHRLVGENRIGWREFDPAGRNYQSLADLPDAGSSLISRNVVTPGGV